MPFQPSEIRFSLPDWVESYILKHPPVMDDATAKMQFVIGATRLNIEQKTGGPFAAAVFELETGRLVSLGVNLVTTARMSLLHGEIVALAVAQAKHGTYDLGAQDLPAHELVTSCEPCAMCFGAIPWSGVKRVITGATDADARATGFHEGPKHPDWQGALKEFGIDTVTQILRDDAAQVLREYSQTGGEIYNSGGN